MIKYKGIAGSLAPHFTSAGLAVVATSALSLGGGLLSSTAVLAGGCGPGPSVVCLGPAAPGTDVTQLINSPGGSLTVTTQPGFGLDVTGGGYGVVIYADGAGDLGFVDENNSSIHADGRALDITAFGLTGAVDVKSTGELVSDGNYGLYLFAGAGVTSSKLDLNRVESANYRGMWVENTGGALSIKSSDAIVGGANSGVHDGLAVSNFAGATGGIVIDVNDVSGSASGIVVDSAGAGEISIKAAGTVTGKAFDGIYVNAGGDSTGLKIDANDIVATGEGMELHYSGTGVVDIDSAGLIDAGTHGIYAIIGANAEGLDIDVNDVKTGGHGIRFNTSGSGDVKVTARDIDVSGIGIWFDSSSTTKDLDIDVNSITSGDDGINGIHSGDGTVNISVQGSVVSGDDAIEFYADNGAVKQINVNVNNAKGANFGIYIVDHSDAIDPTDPAAVNNDLNITTTGKIEAGSGYGIWAETDAGVLSNITVKSTSSIYSASNQAIFNDDGNSHVIIENAVEVVDDINTVEVERSSVTGVIRLGGGADQLDLHGGFSGITEVNGGHGGTNSDDVLNLFNANSTYDANNILGWDVFNIKNSYLTLDGPLGNLNVGTAGVAGTGIFLSDGSTLDSRQPGLNIFGNLTLGAGTTFLSDRNDDAGTPGRGDTYITGFLTNGGTVSIVDGAANDDVAVHGLYTGNNGTVILDTVLGDDSSATDTMTFAGGTAGNTNVIVRNIGGAGAQTVEGIKIINVTGASDGTFALIGDYEIAGQQAVIGGAYGYTLWKNGVNTPADGDWYLRSQLVPVDPVDPSGPLYQPGAPVYEAYPQVLLGLNGLPTLQQRVGNRMWSGNGAGVVSQGADAIGEQAPVADGASPAIEGRGIWGRIEGAYADIDPNVSTTGSKYDFNTQKFQAGLDIPVLENGSGALVGGVTAHYGHASADMSSVFGDGSISTDGYGVGATLTWYGNSGFYLDGQGQVSWYDSDLDSDTLGELTSGNNGSGYALSLETGKRIELNDLTLTPQAQLVYSSVDFDSFTQTIDDLDVADMSLREGDSLRGRLGIALDQEASWQADNGLLSRSHVYSIANLHYEFLDGTAVDVSGAELASRADRLWGGIGLGGSFNWNDDKYSLYGEGSVNTSLENFADSYDLKGTAGFRVSW